MKVPTVKIPRLVVQEPPGRRWLLVTAMVIACAALVWVAFEWGRGNLGLPGGVTPDRVTLRERVNTLEDELRTLRLELAQRESERVGQARERAELAGTIGSLQADLQKLQSELGFYRGVVGDSSDAIKIQKFTVARGSEPGTFRVRLALGRPLNPEGNVSGKLKIIFEGAPGSVPGSVDLAQAAGVAGGELPFDFRYLQEIEQIVRLPEGFTPASSLVELVPARKGVKPVRETFPWAVEN